MTARTHPHLLSLSLSHARPASECIQLPKRDLVESAHNDADLGLASGGDPSTTAAASVFVGIRAFAPGRSFGSLPPPPPAPSGTDRRGADAIGRRPLPPPPPPPPPPPSGTDRRKPSRGFGGGRPPRSTVFGLRSLGAPSLAVREETRLLLLLLVAVVLAAGGGGGAGAAWPLPLA